MELSLSTMVWSLHRNLEDTSDVAGKKSARNQEDWLDDKLE